MLFVSAPFFPTMGPNHCFDRRGEELVNCPNACQRDPSCRPSVRIGLMLQLGVRLGAFDVNDVAQSDNDGATYLLNRLIIR